MVLASRRARSVTFLMTVETTLMKVHVVATWHVVTLNKTCALGNSKLMMNSIGPEGRVKLRLSQLGRVEIILWVPWQVGYSTHLVIRKASTSILASRATSREEEMGQKETAEFKYCGIQTFVPVFVKWSGVDLHHIKT